jgi:hypothetical protein
VDGAALGGPSAWARFCVALVGAAAVLFVALAGAVLLVDPYDTGRLGLFGRTGVRDQAAVTANASRARDPRFVAAILGNSHVQALRPDRLGDLAGLSFAALVMPGSRPRDQIAVLEWYLARRGAQAKALVLGLDAWWCTDDPALPTSGHFPDWLYSPRLADYLKGMIRYRVLEEAAAHLGYRLGLERPVRADGFDDYEPVYLSLGAGDAAAVRTKLARPIGLVVPNRSGRFPSVERLRSALAALPAETALVLLWPPVFPTGLPAPGSPEHGAWFGCRAAIADLARSIRSARIVDWTTRPEAADPGHFFNHDHYKDSLARWVERSIAGELQGRPK